MQATATTTTGVPRYRSENWHNALNPDTDTIARALITQAYSRIVEPTIYRAAYHTLDTLRDHVMAHLPTAEHQRTHTLFRIADNLIGSLAMGVIALSTDLLQGARDPFDRWTRSKPNCNTPSPQWGSRMRRRPPRTGSRRSPGTCPSFARTSRMPRSA